MEPLGNLNKGSTVRTTRGLPFNAPCECTSMHEGSNRLFLTNLSFHTKITNSTRGWPLLGLPTLPTAGERSVTFPSHTSCLVYPFSLAHHEANSKQQTNTCE